MRNEGNQKRPSFKEEIEKMWRDNPDGAGIGIIDINNNLLEPFKTKNLDELQDKLEEIFEKQEFNLVVVHFRTDLKEVMV